MAISRVRLFWVKHKPVIKTLAVFAAAGFLFLFSIVLIWISTFQIPSLKSIEERRISQSTKIYDKTGNVLLYDVSQNTKRTVIPIDKIATSTKNATISIEDKSFYSHHGIDPRAILRAILTDIVTLDFSQGGSTITQQVVKNSLLTGNKTFLGGPIRKIKELVLAIQLEKVLSKEEILSIYLNEIPYGGTVYGVEEASETFFGKNAADVTIAESAYLAAVPKAPTYYSPYGNNKAKLDERKNVVLNEMRSQGMISEQDYKTARAEVVEFKPREDSSIKAPHFVFYTIDYLKNKYGEDVLEKGGLKVITTLDYEMQASAQEIANQYALQNEKTYNASNAAIVAIDPKTGGILTMVGSRDYFDDKIDGAFNVTTAKRQPGSTIKPFIYSEAFLKGYTPETVLFDIKTQFSVNCPPDNLTSENGCYSPEDYDLQYRGPMTLRNALAQSINIPSVKVLYLAGLSESINLARDMGLASLSNKGDYGLTLVLGGGEVTPLEITSGYSVFANNGVRNDYTPIIEVTDKSGNTLEKITPTNRPVLEKEVALKISSILSDNDARAPAYGQTSYLHFPSRDVAVKTGTTNNYKDAWIMGYTPSVAVGAWAGNNDNTPMEKKVAGFIVAPMWRAFMDKVLAKMPSESFENPTPEDELTLKPVLRGVWQGGDSMIIDKVSGKQATEFTPIESMGEIVSGGVHSILYWVDKDNPRGPIPTNPQADSQFVNWEYAVSKWAFENNYLNGAVNIPGDPDNVHTPSAMPKVSIISPSNNADIPRNAQTNVNFSATHQYPIAKVEITLNGVLVASRNTDVSSLTITPSDFNIAPGNYPLIVSVTDSVFNKGSAEIRVNVK